MQLFYLNSDGQVVEMCYQLKSPITVAQLRERLPKINRSQSVFLHGQMCRDDNVLIADLHQVFVLEKCSKDVLQWRKQRAKGFKDSDN